MKIEPVDLSIRARPRGRPENILSTYVTHAYKSLMGIKNNSQMDILRDGLSPRFG